MSVDYYFKRPDGAYLCITNKPYSLPLAFPDGRVPEKSGATICGALRKDWPELTSLQLIAKVERIEQFLGGQDAELLSEYDVHGMPEPVVTIGRNPEASEP